MPSEKLLRQIRSQKELVDSKLETTQVDNLILKYPSGLLEQIGSQFIDSIIAAYHQACLNFYFYLTNEKSSLSLPAQIILLPNTNDPLFKDLYHSPTRYSRLPPWVKGYVNTHIPAYIFSCDRNLIEVKAVGHELTHLFQVAIIKLTIENSSQVYAEPLWSPLISEGMAVGANQRRPIEWLQLRINNTFPTLETISKEGIFSFDESKPESNICYQYCVHLAEKLGQAIKKKEKNIIIQNSNFPPFFFILKLFQESLNRRISFSHILLSEYQIDFVQLETELRASLGLPP